MAGGYEREYQNYLNIIYGKREISPEAQQWADVRLPLDGRPKFLATLSCSTCRVLCIVKLDTYMGEGQVQIPIELYGERPHPIDQAIVGHNQREMGFYDAMGTYDAMRALGLTRRWPAGDVNCFESGGNKILFTIGYEITLARSLSERDRARLILVPEGDKPLHAVSADGLTTHIMNVLPHIRIQPIRPKELRLQAP